MRDWIALNMTPGVGPRAAAKLLERFGSAEGVFGALRSELERLRLRPEAVESIALRDRHEEAARELGRVRGMEGADVLVLDDGAYPALLREIPDPPITLYVRGRWAECLEAPCVAVVGSRRCSTYGQNVALMLARDLASRGVTVVSGLARGIDAAAHRGALEAKGRTAAVLGTGLDEVYPRDHRKLAAGILEKGGAPAPAPADLSDGERAVLKLISTDDPAHIDALAESSGLPVQELSGVLLALEMRDLIRQLPGKCFVRKL